jgi:hypothetical protein
MLTRRQLLSRGTTMLMLVPVIPAVLQACSSGASGGGDDTGGGTCDGNFAVSTIDDSHNHTVCVLTSDLTTPPAAGVTYESSNNGAHTHKVTLTAAQLSSIAAGGQVVVTSTSDVDPNNGDDHTHTWTLSKAASTPTPPPPSGW